MIDENIGISMRHSISCVSFMLLHCVDGGVGQKYVAFNMDFRVADSVYQNGGF